jgi:hypothetical protein
MSTNSWETYNVLTNNLEIKKKREEESRKTILFCNYTIFLPLVQHYNGLQTRPIRWLLIKFIVQHYMH